MNRKDPLAELHLRPETLIRRANQIAVWLFLNEAAPMSMTTTQYGAIVVLNAIENLDQVGLSKLLGIDRSTTALVVKKLIAAGHVALEKDPRDRRRNVLTLTDAGVNMLEAMAGPAERARLRLLSVFNDQEQDRFLGLLERFVDAFNDEIRVPVVTLIQAKAPAQTIIPSASKRP